MRSILRRSVAVVAVTVAVLAGSAVPAQASIVQCIEQGPWPQSYCDVAYQTYPYSPTGTGLRSSMDGVIYAMEFSTADEIEAHIDVWDLKEDGYRARVWLDVFKGCWCDYESHRVLGYGDPLNTTKVFDSHVPSGNSYTWTYVNTDNSWTAYTVRLRVGRFQGSTLNFQWAEEQRFYLTARRY